MSATSLPPRIANRALVAAIDAALEQRGSRARCRTLDRSASPYATSAALEDVVVTLDDGSTHALVLKDMNPEAAAAAVRRTKPSFVIDSRREIWMYQTLLMPRHIGAPLYAADSQSAWLLIERIAGVELYQVGDIEGWVAAAVWLAKFHDSFRSSQDLPAPDRLIQYTAGYYRRWLQRALTFFRDSDPPSRYTRHDLIRLSRHFDAIIARLGRWPVTLLHGDFNASNVLVRSTDAGWMVCPVDWDMAAIGPAVLDLAAITSGNWSAAERRTIVAGYVRAREVDGPSLDEWMEAVSYAQIYLAVQWLGWFGRRRAPAEHSRDWLADAIERAERLELGIRS